jgi:hypothetical protein
MSRVDDPMLVASPLEVVGNAEHPAPVGAETILEKGVAAPGLPVPPQRVVIVQAQGELMLVLRYDRNTNRENLLGYGNIGE